MRPAVTDAIRRLVAALGLVIAGGALVTGCSADDTAVEPPAEQETTIFEPKPTITLVVNDWTASAINAAVAEQLIERHLGYPVVPTRLDNMIEIYDGLADGSIDAMLEIWPSAMTERDRSYFARGEVIDLGPLGPVGKIGWYVPRYVVEEHPELATWEGYRSQDAAALLATADTAPNGRLLGTNPAYRQFDEEIIDNLQLPLEVVFSGSEEHTIEELESRHAAGEPILLYWWSPTAAVERFDLVNVPLPTPTEECLAAADSGGEGVDCDYPEDPLFKAASPALAAKAPDVEAFLRAFTLSTGDQSAMLAAVEVDGRRVDEAAAAWIAANESVWRAWLDT